MFVEMVRLSLFERDQADAFVIRNPDGSQPTREQWLRRVFSSQLTFAHRGSPFTFAPDPHLTSAHDPFLVGRIGRQRFVKENEPPEGRLHEVLRSAWQASLVLIDPTPHEDGQKAAIQVNQEAAGQPTTVFQSLVETLNSGSDPPAPYFIEASAIVDPSTFWQFIAANRGDVTSVSITIIAPNMFNGRSDFENEWRSLRDNEKVHKAKIDLKNQDGLQPDTPRIHETIDYATSGGGEVQAKTRTRKTYSSRRKAKRLLIADPPRDATDLGQYLAGAIREAFRLLGKDK